MIQKLYMDGVLVDSSMVAGLTGPASISNGLLDVGASAYDDGAHQLPKFRGFFDEVRLDSVELQTMELRPSWSPRGKVERVRRTSRRGRQTVAVWHSLESRPGASVR